MQIAADRSKSVLDYGLHKERVTVVRGIGMVVLMGSVDGIREGVRRVRCPEMRAVARQTDIVAVIPELQETGGPLAVPKSPGTLGSDVARIRAMRTDAYAMPHLMEQSACCLIALGRPDTNITAIRAVGCWRS